MAVRLDKPWLALTPENVARLTGHLGVYQLGDEAGGILMIGAADGRSLFGLKGELQRALRNPPAGATRFRVEVTMAYRSRWFELLEAYRHDHGRLPPGNAEIDERRLGWISP